ncbi:MAG TPA: hypothetical protein VF461_24365 [Gemmatimonadaceae bacterium]
MASILTATAGCSKKVESAEVEVPQTNIANKPNVVFLLFGDRTDPRLLPVATSIQGRLAPVTLNGQGWKDFDHLYFRPGTPLSIYRDGKSDGEAVIRRGMWDDAGPLYKLPHCRNLKPLAAVAARPNEAQEVMVERIATSEPLAAPGVRAPVPPSALDSARAIANRVAQQQGLTKNARAELDLAVSAISTGATNAPTLVASFMERGGGIHGHPRHLFLLADSTGHGYDASFIHVAGDSLPEFRRLIDHADITGDGIDELMLEGWANGGQSYLLFLRFVDGKWVEMARGETSWCADPKKKS